MGHFVNMSHLAPYQSVSCKMHSDLEWAIMQAKSLKLTYYKDNKAHI